MPSAPVLYLEYNIAAHRTPLHDHVVGIDVHRGFLIHVVSEDFDQTSDGFSRLFDSAVGAAVAFRGELRRDPPAWSFASASLTGTMDRSPSLLKMSASLSPPG